jgi:DNA polymerase-1
LADLHEIVGKILEYRTLTKLNSTYVDGLQKAINAKTGRLHTSFNQTITATGRLSSTEPNLQNIPVRVELGRRIRKAFKASKGNLLLAADYSQIELRILAHLSEDENFLDAFNTGQDIHTRTAHEVFDVAEQDVTGEMRRRAKAVNFGIVYGISDYGLAKDLRIPRSEAKTYIQNYFKRYTGVKQYIDNTISDAKNLGYVSTIFNRKRYIPDILSSNHNVRNFGERMAMNSPIQGAAADIIKIAMINIFRVFTEQKITSKMLLQVHDELIFEVPVEELENTAKIVKELMENACILKVPLEVDLKVGENWYSMKKYQGGTQNA